MRDWTVTPLGNIDQSRLIDKDVTA